MSSKTYGWSLGAAVAVLSACSGGGSSASVETRNLGDEEPIVRDGRVGDIDVQSGTDSLAANWSGFPLPVDHYQWCIGTTPLGADVHDWRSVELPSGHALGLNLTRGRTYFVSVRAVTSGVPGPAKASNGVRIKSESIAPRLLTLDDTSVDLARKSQLIRFNAALKGGAHTWVFEGGEFAKAAIAFAGDTRADVKLLDQIRYVLRPGNCPTCTGGFQDQKQLGTTAMFLLARKTPRIWNALSSVEQTRIETSVTGALVSSAFTTSDNNPFVLAGTPQWTLDGDSNLSRDWNPNFRNGMLGTVIVATLFFGGPEKAQAMLKAHDHAAFLQTLRTLDLRNLLGTYTAPNPNRPTTAQIEAALRADYTYRGIPLQDLMGLYLTLTEFTYERTVNTGLNGGKGEMGSNQVLGGYMAKNASQLPNQGKVGMLREFQAFDAKGNRSSAHYANDGWYVNNYIQYSLIACGVWQDSARAQRVLDRVAIGTADLRFKIDPKLGGGYHHFQHGEGGGTPYVIQDSYGHRINFAVAAVLAGYHGR